MDIGKRFLLNVQGEIFKEWEPGDPAGLPVVSGLTVYQQADEQRDGLIPLADVERGGPPPTDDDIILGAEAVHVGGIAELKAAMVRARAAQRTQVMVIDTTHERTTADGGWWWEVAVPEVSARAEVAAAKRSQIEGKRGQRS